MKNVLICALVLGHFLVFPSFSGTLAHAQSENIQITFKKNFLEKTLVKALIFSDNLGQVKAFYHLDDFRTNDHDFRIDIPKSSRLDLTLLSHYIRSYEKNQHEYVTMMTIFDIQNDQLFDVEENYVALKDRSTETETIRMEITGCQSLEDLIVDRKFSHQYFKYNHQQHKDVLRLKYDKTIGEDVFILLKANGEDFYRYLYLEDNQPVPSEVDIQDLNTDLVAHRLELPIHEHWNGFVSKMNPTTGTECVLYSAQRPFPETDEILFYVPEKKVTGPYFFDISTVGIKGFPKEAISIKGFYQNLPTDFSQDDTWVDDVVLTPDHLSFSLYGTYDYFSVRLARDLMDLEHILADQQLLYWDLLGLNHTEIDFHSIQFTREILDAFPILQEVNLTFSKQTGGSTYLLRQPLPNQEKQNPFTLFSKQWLIKNILNSRQFSIPGGS